MVEYAKWADVPARHFGMDQLPVAHSVQARGVRSTGPTTDGKVLAMPGDLITCPDGHPAFRVVEPVTTGLIGKAAWFRRLDCDEPPERGKLVACPECGCAVFPAIRNLPPRYAIFVNDRIANGARQN